MCAAVEAPIELARHLVFGAADYARGLGFEPARDFEANLDSHVGGRDSVPSTALATVPNMCSVPSWLQIQVTPPSLADDSMQLAELELLGVQQGRAVDGRLDEDALADLAGSGWLRQDRHARGAYLSTSGMRSQLDHPELVMLNVPSGAVAWAAQTLNGMGAYLEATGTRFEPGERYVQEDDVVNRAFTFAKLDVEGATSIGFERLQDPFLVVIPLP